MDDLSMTAPMTGAPNFRDLGGIPTTDGRRIAPGRVYRSEALHGADEADWARITQLGIRLVCDLRSPTERATQPYPWRGAAPRIAEFGLLPDERTNGADVMQQLLADPTGRAAGDFLVENYALMPASFEAGLRELLTCIVDRRELPVLISCREGKDRTGFVCALLLLAVGVGRADVVTDYMRSDAHFDRGALSTALTAHLTDGSATPPSPAILDSLRVNTDYLEGAFRAIDDRYGSVDAYLQQAGGLDEHRRERLRTLLLEP